MKSDKIDLNKGMKVYPAYAKAEAYTKGTAPGVKHDNGKIRYDLYPINAYKGCTEVITFGANKYTDNGWRTVRPKKRYYAALMRHLLAQLEWEDAGNQGLAVDEESGLPHLDHAQCCLIFYREITDEDNKQTKLELND